MINRTVGIFDILGFKQLVENTPTSNLGKSFSVLMGTFSEMVNTHWSNKSDTVTFFPNLAKGDTLCNRFVFSDSIILISHDDSEDSCFALLIHAFKVMQLLIGNMMPVRGAVSFGEMYADFNNSLFLGKALTKAYELEQKQNWIGAIIDDTVSDKFPRVLSSEFPVDGLRQKLFPQYEVPMKSGVIRSYSVINWMWNVFVESGIHSLFDDSGNWAAKTKVDATLDFEKKMHQLNSVYPDQSADLPFQAQQVVFPDRQLLHKSTQ